MYRDTLYGYTIIVEFGVPDPRTAEELDHLKDLIVKAIAGIQESGMKELTVFCVRLEETE